ncbi:MAG: monofunctional biosynthetic peptidoglycan transglycosylase, partial [Bacteroidales bacterium]
WRKLKKIILACIVLFLASSVLTTIVYRFVNPPITPLMLIRTTQQLMKGEALKLKKDWVPIEEISPNMVRAVVAGEDNLFITHAGFDVKAIAKAQKYNDRKQGKKIHGGSTISQQTAKNVFLWPNRSYIRKGLEVYFTVLIEAFWPKERIMEVYLNVIEMGNGIYGIQTAAETYYGISAKNLSKSQSAMIATILPAPRKRNPAHPSSYMYRHQKRILSLMRKIGPTQF